MPGECLCSCLDLHPVRAVGMIRNELKMAPLIPSSQSFRKAFAGLRVILWGRCGSLPQEVSTPFHTPSPKRKVLSRSTSDREIQTVGGKPAATGNRPFTDCLHANSFRPPCRDTCKPPHSRMRCSGVHCKIDWCGGKFLCRIRLRLYRTSVECKPK